MPQSGAVAGEPWWRLVCIWMLLGGGLLGLFAEMLCVWYPPPRSSQGELPAGPSSPLQEAYRGAGLCQSCVMVSAFQPFGKTRGSQ